MGLVKRIIPCLDVTSGRVVKGVNFVGLRDAGDPVEIARRYDEQGADELCFLDITASSDERGLILSIVESVAAQVFIPLTVGGGVRSVSDVRDLLNAGADKVSINTAAVLRAAPGGGSQRQGRLAVHRGRHRRETCARCGPAPLAGLHARWSASCRAGRARLGPPRAGTRRGRDSVDQHGPGRHAPRVRPGADPRAFSDALDIPIIASGGVGNLDHFVEGVQAGHADAVLAASIFHYGEYTVRQAKEHMAAAGIEVRL